MASIGACYGFYWQTLWTLPENAGLRRKRANPNVLHPGDKVFVPALRARDEECPSDNRYQFRLKGRPESLRIRLLDAFDHPRPDLTYELIIDGVSVTGRTNPDGEIVQRISPLARSGKLFLGDDRVEVPLRLGHLDPVSETTGMQSRLANLGYDVGNVDGNLGPKTRAALREFQEHLELACTGEPDQLTLSKLNERHGH